MGLLAEMQASLSPTRLAQLTNPDAPQNVAAGVNLALLQQAVFYAQSTFQIRTGNVYDDSTVNAVGPPLVLNLCHPVGLKLAVAWLYDYRAHPWPDAEVREAWASAWAELKAYMTQIGVGRWAAPGTDSNFVPSIVPPGTLPDMDRLRLGSWAADAPSPTGNNLPGDLANSFGNS